MKTTWPAAINSGSEIESRIGLLQSLFLSKKYERTVALLLATLPCIVGIILFICYFTDPRARGFWIGGTIAFVVSLALFGLARWYQFQRHYFCICSEGVAFAEKLSATPIVLPWSDVTSIQILEDVYLKMEEQSMYGFKVSETAREATRSWLNINAKQEAIRFKLKEFPDKEALLEQLIEQTKEKDIALDYNRVESNDLVAAKMSRALGESKKTKFYALGVVIFIILMILRVVVKLNR